MKLQAQGKIKAGDYVTATTDGKVQSTKDVSKAIGKANFDSEDGFVEVTLGTSVVKPKLVS